MPLRNGHITPQERAAVDAYARTGDKAYAGQVAGYKHATAVHRTLARPQIHAEIVRTQQDILLKEGLAAAVTAHLDLLSPGTPAGARVQAVKLMYDRVLGDKGERDDKDPAQMTRAEMLEEYARLTREAADQAKLVDAEVIEPEPPKEGFFG